MRSTLKTCTLVSTTTVTPAGSPPDAAKRIDLTAWDLSMLTLHYLQKGLVFSTPHSSPTDRARILDQLKSSLSIALQHFYPLAGRLATEKSPSNSGISVYIDCCNRGVEFIHAIDEDISVADITSTFDGLPPFYEYIPLNGAVNHDGHELPLLAVQMTELEDGIFIGCSCNHMVADGTSFWHFLNSWAEISCGGDISRLLVIARWYVDESPPPLILPYTHHSEFIERVTLPGHISERRFLFSAASLQCLKKKTRKEAESATGDTTAISAFQAVAALVWRAITRARCLTAKTATACLVVANNRRRLNPPLSDDHFGCYIGEMVVTVPAGELLANSLGWSASKLHHAIAMHDDSAIVGEYRSFSAMPEVVRLSAFDRGKVAMLSSPRFDMYDGVDFGWGKPVAVRGGSGNRIDGRVSMNPGREGGGSIEVEVFLSPPAIGALEVDEELTGAMNV